MKKTILVALAAVGAVVPAAAQGLNYRVEAGLNSASMSLSGKEYSGANISSKLGLRVSAIAEYKLGDKGLYALAGLGYRANGAKWSYTGDHSNSVKLDYLTLTPGVGYRHNLSEQVALSVEGSVYGGYLLSAKSESTHEGKSETTDMLSGKEKENVNRLDLGAGVSVGVEYQRYFLRVGHEWGFANLFKGDAAKDISVKNNNLYLTVGVKF